MADFGQVIGAQQLADPSVQQNSVANTQAAQANSAQLALQYDQHQQNLQNYQIQKQQFEQKQAQWNNDQIGSILSISNPTLRQAKFDQYQKLAQAQGLAVDPNIRTLLKDQDWINNAQQAHAQINGLPYDQKMAAMQDIKNLMGSADGLDKDLQTAGEIMQQRYATNLNAQVSMNQLALERRYKALGMTQDEQKAQYEQNKDSYAALQSAKNVEGILSDPNSLPIEINDAKGTLDKIVNQGAVLRPQTMTMLGDSSQGLVNDAKKLLNKITGQGSVTNEDRVALLKISQRFAMGMNQELLNKKSQYAKMNAGTGIDVDQVFSGMPQYSPTKFDPVTGYKLQNPGAPSPTMNARTGASGGWDSAPSANAAPAQDPVKAFGGLDPNMQQAMQKRAAGMGIQLDPKDPQFGVKYQQFMQKLQLMQMHGGQ